MTGYIKHPPVVVRVDIMESGTLMFSQDSTMTNILKRTSEVN